METVLVWSELKSTASTEKREHSTNGFRPLPFSFEIWFSSVSIRVRGSFVRYYPFPCLDLRLDDLMCYMGVIFIKLRAFSYKSIICNVAVGQFTLKVTSPRVLRSCFFSFFNHGSVS